MLLHSDRLFLSDPSARGIARESYEQVKDLPIVSPHGHTQAAWFAQNTRFPDPATLFVQPDHYIYRMLYSQGIALEDLEIGVPVIRDPRRVWKIFASHYWLFRAQMLTEMAQMSVEDGLVMQIHPGATRNHNRQVYARFGRDTGADIPRPTSYVDTLRPVLDKVGNEPGLTIILFTLDESTYSRELAPLAAHYPSLRLGPPWGFHDSPEGMMRFREQATETAGSTTRWDSTSIRARSCRSRRGVMSLGASTARTWGVSLQSTASAKEMPPKWRTILPVG